LIRLWKIIVAKLKFNNPTTTQQKYTYVKVRAFNWSIALNIVLITYILSTWVF